MIATRKPSCQFQEEEEEEEAGFWRVSQAPPLPDRMSLSEGSNPPWNEFTPTVGEITRVTMETLSPLICYNIWQKHKARVYLKDFPCTFAEDCAGKDVPWALAFRVTSQRRQDNHLNRVDNLWNKRRFMKLFLVLFVKQVRFLHPVWIPFNNVRNFNQTKMNKCLWFKAMLMKWKCSFDYNGKYNLSNNNNNVHLIKITYLEKLVYGTRIVKEMLILIVTMTTEPGREELVTRGHCHHDNGTRTRGVGDAGSLWFGIWRRNIEFGDQQMESFKVVKMIRVEDPGQDNQEWWEEVNEEINKIGFKPRRSPHKVDRGTRIPVHVQGTAGLWSVRHDGD